MRREVKYLIGRDEAEEIKELVKTQLPPDIHGASVISNLYLDTPDMLLIRRSVSRPVFKEKLRLRSYGANTDTVFAEIKRKYNSVVSKRRIRTTEKDALLLISGKRPPETQAEREISYFSSIYAPLSPTVYLSYHREAYESPDGSLRLTFDSDLCRRTADLTLSVTGGTPMLDPDSVLMEIKTDSAIPLWLTEHLSKRKIYCTSFSKYGAAYREIMNTKKEGENTNAYYASV